MTLSARCGVAQLEYFKVFSRNSCPFRDWSLVVVTLISSTLSGC